MQKIAIIGGGFSGVCVAIYLIEKASAPLSITLIEKESEICLGIAYKTTFPFHPLNVPAGKMGALSNQPNHFLNWLNMHQSWRNKDPSFEKLMITPESYLPRMLYPLYLRDLFQQALEKAKMKNVSCKVIHDCAEDVTLTSENQFAIQLSRHSSLIADDLVLAVGVPSHQNFSFERKLYESHYISNFWDLKKSEDLQKQFLNERGKGKTIAIIGSGLTAVDALFSLYAMNYQGTVCVISKSGSFPQVHSKKMLAPWFHFHSHSLPNKLLDYLRLFKKQLSEINQLGLDWRQLIDAYRSSVEFIWHGLTQFEKKQFIRHLFPLWNKHRHRMSQESDHVVNFFMQKGALIFCKGAIYDVHVLPDNRLQIEYHKENNVESFEADCLINCSGPNYQIKENSNLLIKNLLKKEFIFPDAIGLGLKVIEKEVLAGKGYGHIFGIGALLFGERLETTAVPDLREQANSIANRLLQKCVY